MTASTDAARAAAGAGPGSALPDTRRLRFLLAGIVTCCFFGLVFTMAFRPDWLGAGRDGLAAAAGLLASLAMILLVFAVMALFVMRIGTGESASGSTRGR